MTEYNELLADARKLEEKLRQDTVVTYASEGETVRTLADVVEAYSKADSECAAACKTCEKEIGNMIDTFDQLADILRFEPDKCHIELRAARKLARVAVENYEKAKGGG